MSLSLPAAFEDNHHTEILKSIWSHECVFLWQMAKSQRKFKFFHPFYKSLSKKPIIHMCGSCSVYQKWRGNWISKRKEEMGLHHHVLQHQTCSLSEKEKECPPPPSPPPRLDRAQQQHCLPELWSAALLSQTMHNSYIKFMKRRKDDFDLWYLLQVNTQLFSAREKQQLAELIDTMIGYNLTYHQERNFEGQYTYVLDPWVSIV